jgi:hypothetical protein
MSRMRPSINKHVISFDAKWIHQLISVQFDDTFPHKMKLFLSCCQIMSFCGDIHSVSNIIEVVLFQYIGFMRFRLKYNRVTMCNGNSEVLLKRKSAKVVRTEATPVRPWQCGRCQMIPTCWPHRPKEAPPIVLWWRVVDIAGSWDWTCWSTRDRSSRNHKRSNWRQTSTINAKTKRNKRSTCYRLEETPLKATITKKCQRLWSQFLTASTDEWLAFQPFVALRDSNTSKCTCG